MRLGPFSGFASALAFASTVVRAEPAEVVALTYRAPPACPDERAFVAAVQARTARATFAAEGARRFSVWLEKRAEGFHGRLSVRGGMRDLASPRCEDLFEAFVLFVAIAIDPDAPPVPAPSPPDEAPPVDAPPVPLTPPPPRRPPPSRPPPPPRPPAWHWSFGSGAFLAAGVARRALVSAHPFVDLASDAVGVSPGLRLGLVWANGNAEPAPDSPAKLTLGLRALALTGCAFHFTAPAALSVRACGAVEAGWLTVRPFGLAYPRSPDRPWLATGPVLRGELPILPRLALGTEVGALFPFERERVYVRGNPAVALVSAVGIRLSAVLVVTGF